MGDAILTFSEWILNTTGKTYMQVVYEEGNMRTNKYIDEFIIYCKENGYDWRIE